MPKAWIVMIACQQPFDKLPPLLRSKQHTLNY